MKNPSIDLYFENNERFVNKTISTLILFAIPVCPLLIILKLTGIFHNPSVLYLTVIGSLFDVVTIGNYFYVKKHRLPPNYKYFILIVIEFLICSLSLDRGLGVVISYTIPVILSCIYFNERLTLNMSIISILFTVLSYILRSYLMVPERAVSSRQQWSAAYATGTSIELLVLSVFCYYLSREIRIALTSIYHHRKQIDDIQDQLLYGLSNIVEAKDTTTGEHIKRTSEYVRVICNQLQNKGVYTDYITPHTTELMVRAAPFHDLGKISVTDEILNKPGKLTQQEFFIIQRHPIDGATFLATKLMGIDDEELLVYAKEMAMCHHERLDGNGYPYRLIQDEIPICARIMAVADILDALLSDRPYKTAYTLENSLQILKDMSGTALDSNIVDAVIDSRETIQLINSGSTGSLSVNG